uniref:RIN4 pathogenic type III effector avirulence factor Avr cleavage site domain-containing protein n=1 Tax=Oryza punctata TaxID=4537 RepID=A0A0E0K4P2_ORYPU
MSDETGRTIPKFGAWDVNNPASADGFTVIFSKARDEKKGPVNVDASTRSNSDSKDSNNNKTTEKINPYHRRTNSASKKWFCCVSPSPTQP